MNFSERYRRPLTEGELLRILGGMLLVVIFVIAALDVYLGRMTIVGHTIILGGSALIAAVMVLPILLRK